MATLPSDPLKTKLSFAKVAASAFTPTSSAQIHSNNPTTSNNQDAIGARENPAIVTAQPATFKDNIVKPKRLVQLAGRDLKTPDVGVTNGPQLLVHNPQQPPTGMEGPSALNGAASVSDENATQLTSSDGSTKPPSLDGKSVASGTTFALDEKESLRPDDSASLKAIEDEEPLSAQGSAIVGSRFGSDTGARAFRDQLREISSMGPSPRPSGPTVKGGPVMTAQPGMLYVPVSLAGENVMPGENPGGPMIDVNEFSPDEKLLEALNNPRDRIWVLKLEQDILDFIKDTKEHAYDVPQCNSFYRMLAHKLADYYLLGHVVDATVSSVRLYKTQNCRLPPPLTGITTPSTAASTPPPAAPMMKILRRGGDGSGPVPGVSKPTSEADGDSGSDGGRKSKGPMTREEREARYEAARLRILGSAKPTEELAIAKDESRSSSAAGKKKNNGKKQRSNSDDDFQARSAYSTYGPSAYAGNENNGTNPNGAMFSAFNANSSNTYGPSNPYASQEGFNATYGPMMPSDMTQYPWLQPAYQAYSEQSSQGWDQSQQSGYDLSADFQQAMSFQQPGVPNTFSPVSGQPNGSYMGGNFAQGQEHQGWSQQPSFQNPYQVSGNYLGQPPTYDRPTSSSSSQSQPYQYGVLPNQTTIGGKRIPNPNHPIVGSFNRHQQFNPQSQSFIPGQSGAPAQRNFSPMASPNPTSFVAQHGPYSMQRQNSSQSQNSSYSSPRPAQQNNNTRNQGMMHPLPQPVFSPNVPLPQSRGMNAQPNTQQTSSLNSSSISKWGTPASLPAKPPPPADSFDMSKLSPNPRLPAFNPAVAARLPGGGMPFNHMPQMVSMRGSPMSQSPRSGQ